MFSDISQEIKNLLKILTITINSSYCLGEVRNHSFSELKECVLLDGLSDKTSHTIPTLKEVLLVVRDRVLINLDNTQEMIPIVYELLKETGTKDQAIFSSYHPYKKLKASAGPYLDSIIYMPKVKQDTERPKEYLNTFFTQTHSPILQTRALTEEDALLEIIPYAKGRKRLIWFNSLENFHCAGHTDEKEMMDPSHWNWFLDHRANIIQTDRPAVAALFTT